MNGRVQVNFFLPIKTTSLLHKDKVSSVPVSGLTFKAGKKAYIVKIKIEFGFWAYVGSVDANTSQQWRWWRFKLMQDYRANVTPILAPSTNTNILYCRYSGK